LVGGGFLMAGRGPAPKDPSKRARRNADVVALRVVEVVPAGRPDLPEFDVELKVDGEAVMVPFVWPAATRDWWGMLEHHPLKGEFTELDWSYLLDTALLHARFWQGKIDIASELRLREAKYGFTPEDRARLRIQFAQAAEAEVDASRKVETARDRMRGIRPA
jgi:hypothetical protein